MKSRLSEKSTSVTTTSVQDNQRGISRAAVPMFQNKSTLQGKFVAQRVGPNEEEEPLQMKPAVTQLANPEEEEPLQMKSAVAQLVGPNEEEEPLQMKTIVAQLVGPNEEEEPLQMKEDAASKSNKTGLPDNLKTGVENLSGMSLNDVKVHYNSSKPAQLNALAFAQGTDIHVGAGQEKHLPHEAWHVVQQKQGRVQPTMQMKEGVPINDDKGLESEADTMGAKALSHGTTLVGHG